ncbi:MAG TPA: hypothetical protein VHQ87_14285 [Rhizobacter sp.]|jgi:hypothetical protein|nr:hypothetical protein [Rhizobacter sp.]
MTTTRFTHRLVAAATALAMAAPAVQAASPAASSCPDYFFLSGNLALNSNFETPSAGVPIGTSKCWQNGDPSPVNSAAANWQMHSSNAGATVCSTLVSGSAPGPGGSYLLAFRAGGNEGGIYQSQVLDPKKAYMFSVWVMVRYGQVAIQSRGMIGGPVAWTSKVGEWEQLRVCTNSLANTDMLVIYNQAPNGGTFYVDRAELREIPIRE